MKHEGTAVSHGYSLTVVMCVYLAGLLGGMMTTAFVPDDSPLRRWLAPAKPAAARNPVPADEADAALRDLIGLRADATEVTAFVPADLSCYIARRDPFFATPSYSAAGHEVLPYPPAEVP